MKARDGLPAWAEAALEDALEGGSGICPFCGEPYREEAASIAAESVWGHLTGTLRRCACGSIALPLVQWED